VAKLAVVGPLLVLAKQAPIMLVKVANVFAFFVDSSVDSSLVLFLKCDVFLKSTSAVGSKGGLRMLLNLGWPHTFV